MAVTKVVRSGGEVRLSASAFKSGTVLGIRLYARLDDGQQIALPDFDLEVGKIDGFAAQTLWSLLSLREPGRGFASGWWQALADALAGHGIARRTRATAV
jgi:hypothetical protein